MNQAQTQQQQETSSDKDKQKYYDSILAAVNSNKSSISTSSTQQIIQKYKISLQSDPNKISNILALESINEILLEFKKSGQIVEEKGKYYYGGKVFTEKQIKESIVKSFKAKISTMVDMKFEKIKIELKKQSNNKKIEINQQRKQQIATNIASLKTQLKAQEELIEKKTEQYMNSLYKQNKAISEARKETAQINFNNATQKFQQDTLSAKDKQLTQAYQGQQIQLNQQRLEIDAAKQRQDRHIDDMEARYQAALRQQQQYEDKQKQLKQQHEETQRLQKEIADRNDQNIKNQIAAAKANNEALITANQQNTQAQITANQQNTQAQITANQQNTQAIIESQTRGDNAIVQGLNQIGANINSLQSNFSALNTQFQDLNKNMNTLGNKLNTPPPPQTIVGHPPACTHTDLRNLGCTATGSWQLKTQSATNIRTGQQGITIYYCSAGYHYCALDGNSGQTSDINSIYTW